MKIRVIFEKTGRGIYFGHLDMMFQIEKVLRRTNIDFVRGHGYKRKIKYSSSPAVKLGREARCYIDVGLEKSYSPEFLKQEFSRQFPDGFKFLDVEIL